MEEDDFEQEKILVAQNGVARSKDIDMIVFNACEVDRKRIHGVAIDTDIRFTCPLGCTALAFSIVQNSKTQHTLLHPLQ